MPTPHNNARKEDIAKVVLMPGDPLRAKWIAETFLVNPVLVNTVRNVFGYTGLTKNGKRITVMASGMGMPSIGIYSHELFAYYDVDVIIRIGTCGTYQKDVDVGSVILAQGACTDSNWIHQYGIPGCTFSAIADFEVLEEANRQAQAKGKKIHIGNILSADVFYNADSAEWKAWQSLGVLGVEMEAYALYTNAAFLKKKSLSMFTVSDSFLESKEMTPEQRQTGLVDMVEIAIATVEKFA